MVSVAQEAQIRQRPVATRWKPLWEVMAWEMRRIVASPVMWVTALAVFGIFALVMLWRAFPREWGFGDGVVGLRVDLPYGSAMRLLYDMPSNLLFLLVLLVVFAVADGVARDWHRRTHELVMVTELPTWAYIWGRYLVATAVSLFFAVELLLAILLLITIEHVINGGADYPAAQLGPVLATWAAVVLPTTIFVGGLSFALSTLFFRATTLVKLATALGWFIWLGALPALTQGNANVPQWLLSWDPTYVALIEPGSHEIYYRALSAGVAPLEGAGQPVSQDQLLGLFNHMVNTLPDLNAWLPPHLVWAAGAVGLVAVTSLVFKRYQNAA
jgi:ABC-type transport system involved in multi-copper enzyme maturation permease subunit